MSEAAGLSSGDILVTVITVNTQPSWTPLFTNISAIVTDSGGILSRCAVIAREYGIPAVVGTGTATSVISDGQTIEVNGDTGLVIINPSDTVILAENGNGPGSLTESSGLDY